MMRGVIVSLPYERQLAISFYLVAHNKLFGIVLLKEKRILCREQDKKDLASR